MSGKKDLGVLKRAQGEKAPVVGKEKGEKPASFWRRSPGDQNARKSAPWKDTKENNKKGSPGYVEGDVHRGEKKILTCKRDNLDATAEKNIKKKKAGPPEKRELAKKDELNQKKE